MNNIENDYHVRESIRSIRHAPNEDLSSFFFLFEIDDSEFLRKKSKINRLRHIERKKNEESPLISVRNVHSTKTTTIRRGKGHFFFFFFLGYA